MSVDESWRGVAAEEVDEVDTKISALLQARSRKLLGSLTRPYVWACVLALAVVVLQNAASMAGPLLIAAAIDNGIPAAMRGDASTLAWCIGAYVFSSVANSVLLMTFQRLSGRIGQDILRDLRERVFHHSQRLSLSFHESYTSGKVISRLTADVDTIAELLDDGLNQLLNAVLSLVGIGVLLMILDVPLALLVLAGFVPLVLMTRWFQRRSKRTYRRTRAAIAKIIVQFVETMNGMRAVQAFRRERRNESIMDDLNEDYREASYHALSAVAAYTASVRFVGNISLALILGVGAWRVTGGSLELGVLTAFTLYLRRFYDPLDQLAMVTNSYSAASAALEKISGVLEESPSVPEPIAPQALPDRGGAITFTQVEFRYSADTPLVLPTFDLTIPAGQTVALVGATGAGKSTIAKLVGRFYDPSSGSVQLSGVDLRDVADTDLRRHVVTVTQENFLFSGSVADNIALGRPTATRGEVESAAAAVGAHEFIAALPDGYDTDVRKRGGRLSAGQRQLVAFARAFLADPAVLVLDEATSSLDVPSERAVQSALETVLADRTALIIAHRLSTVLIADRVLVVDGGRIVEDGSPEELVADGRGEFAALHRAWLDSLV